MTLSSFLVAAVIVAVAHGWTDVNLISDGYDGCEDNEPSPATYTALHNSESDGADLAIKTMDGQPKVEPVNGFATLVWSPALIDGKLTGGADYTVTLGGRATEEAFGKNVESVFLLGARSGKFTGMFKRGGRTNLINCVRTRTIDSGPKKYQAPASGSVFIRVIYGNKYVLEDISATIPVAAVAGGLGDTENADSKTAAGGLGATENTDNKDDAGGLGDTENTDSKTAAGGLGATENTDNKNAVTPDKGDASDMDASGSTTISASFLAFVGAFVVLLA